MFDKHLVTKKTFTWTHLQRHSFCLSAFAGEEVTIQVRMTLLDLFVEASLKDK
jgi:hypothetical protein